ncbi:MAG TPA: L,D-transpeptidase [Longimicrobium sp.]|nr:L,D-transpeptidase [Longimicrobium sp.]
MQQKWKSIAAAAAMILAPAALHAQEARRPSGLIVSSMEQAVSRPVERVENFSLLVDLSDRTLYALSGREVVRSWPVSVGQEGYNTPAGQYTIGHMIWNPRWVPPSSDWARDHKPEPPGAISNPMGRVKMFFREPDLYIHGTYLPSSLGNARSHGCIRMRNIDAVELARVVMIQGGSDRPQEWYDRAVAVADTSREVQLRTPVRLRVRQ